MKFERGDIIAFEVTDTGSTGVFVLDYTYGGNSCCVICGVTGEGELVFNDRGWGVYDSHRFATESDKTILFNALSKQNKYYCEQTKTIKEMKKEFTKEDLKSGMWIECRNGNRYLLINDKLDGKLWGYRDRGKIKTEDLNDNLTFPISQWDIIKIWHYDNPMDTNEVDFGSKNLVWQRNTKQDQIKSKIDEIQSIVDDMQEDIKQKLESINKLKEELK